MSKLAIGDRVKVYGYGNDGHLYKGMIGVVENILVGNVSVKLFVGYDTRVHSKQCKKLKSPKPPREIWVNVYPESPHKGMSPYGGIYQTLEAANVGRGAIDGVPTLFREVRKKKLEK